MDRAALSPLLRSFERHPHRHRPVVIPGLLAALAILDAIRRAPEPNSATAHRSGSGCNQ
jgi:hypothetical protein